MLKGYKTYLVCLSAFLVALAQVISQYANGETVEFQFVIDSLLAIALLFLRKGIKTDTQKVN